MSPFADLWSTAADTPAWAVQLAVLAAALWRSWRFADGWATEGARSRRAARAGWRAPR